MGSCCAAGEVESFLPASLLLAYPISQLSLLKKPSVKSQTSQCGGLLAVVLESCESNRPLCCLCRGVVAAGRRGGGGILGQLRPLICFWSKLDARMVFPCILVNDLSVHRITEGQKAGMDLKAHPVPPRYSHLFNFSWKTRPRDTSARRRNAHAPGAFLM